MFAMIGHALNHKKHSFLVAGLMVCVCPIDLMIAMQLTNR